MLPMIQCVFSVIRMYTQPFSLLGDLHVKDVGDCCLLKWTLKARQPTWQAARLSGSQSKISVFATTASVIGCAVAAFKSRTRNVIEAGCSLRILK